MDTGQGNRSKLGARAPYALLSSALLRRTTRELMDCITKGIVHLPATWS